MIAVGSASCRSQSVVLPTKTLAGLNKDGIDPQIAFLLQAIADGNHDRLTSQMLGIDQVDLQILFDGYVTAYGLACSQFLPLDKVEWTIKRCEASKETKDGDFECVREGDVHTHVFVDKNILELKHTMLTNLRLPQEITPEGTRTVMPDLQQMFQNTFGSNSDRLRERAFKLWISPAKLVTLNGCLSPQLRRFQDNLLSYAIGVPTTTPTVPLTRPASVPSRSSPPLPDGNMSFSNIDYRQVILDFIGETKRGSTLRDVPLDSIKNIRTTYTDRGRPGVVQADCTILWDDGHPPPCNGILLVMSHGQPLCVELKPDHAMPFNELCAFSNVSVSDGLRSKFQGGGYSH